MKIFISYPPIKGPGCPTLGQNRQFQWFSNPSFIYPMVPASAATLLKKHGHRIVWNDCIAENRNEDSFWQHLKIQKPDLIAMETKTPVVRQHWKIVDRIKDILPDTTVVLMGDHITAMPDETMESCSCDFAITGGDYDFSLLSIVQHVEDGRPLLPGIWFRSNGFVQHSGVFEHGNNSLDDLPWIDRKMTKWQLYGEKLYKRKPFTYTMAGRDCSYGKCTFCSWTTLYPRFRVRSPENVVDEIQYLVSDFGVKEIFDDTGTFPTGGWLERFCENMIRKRLPQKSPVFL